MRAIFGRRFAAAKCNTQTRSGTDQGADYGPWDRTKLRPETWDHKTDVSVNRWNGGPN